MAAGRWAALGLAAAAIAACGGLRPPLAVPAIGGDPWLVPASEIDTQRLLRADLDTADGGARLRLTLRLAAGTYQLIAADTLGRPVWTVHVEGERALFVDHREAFWCEGKSREAMRALPLGAPIEALPAVLLGRLPLVPSGEPVREGDHLSYRSVAGRRIEADVRGGAVESWTLWNGDQPAYWWTAAPGGGVLTARRERVVLRWEQVVREPLPSVPVPPVVPPSFRRGTCTDAPANAAVP